MVDLQVTRKAEVYHNGRLLSYKKREHKTMQTIDVTIQGLTPLIVNRFHEDAAEEATSGTHSRKERLSPEDDARERLYQNGHGPYLPAENVRQSMIVAAGRHKIGRRAATSDTAAAIYIFPFELLIDGDWHVDSRAVVIPATKGRILRHRPMFDDWTMSFKMQVDTDLVSASLIQTILNDAGKLVGLGDFRPARKGPYGRFTVTSWTKE